MHPWHHFMIQEGSGSRFDMSNEVWSLVLTALREVYLGADPRGAAFLGVAGLRIIGRVDEKMCGRNALVVRRPPAERGRSDIILLHPHSPEGLDGRDFA